jgi:PAS domain-containing protein
MSDAIDPIPRWTRELAHLRTRATKRGRGAADAGTTEVTEIALATCDSLLRDLAGAHLECERLRAELRSSSASWERLFDLMPSACVLTDEAGVILNANQAAGVALNISGKHLKDRPLLVFSENRPAFSDLLSRLARGTDYVRTSLTIRPRERKPAPMDVFVLPLDGHRPGLLLWFLTASESQRDRSDDPLEQTALSA